MLTEQKIQQSELYERSRNYWLSRLDSLFPAPDLPLDKRPKSFPFAATTVAGSRTPLF